MKDVVTDVEKLPLGREVRKFSSGLSELWFDGKKISYSFSNIGPFEYIEEIDNYISFVEIKLGNNLSLNDCLFGIMDINGNMLSPLYSERYGVSLNDKDVKSIDKAVDNTFRKLLTDSRTFDDKNKSERNKMKLLVKINNKKS